MDIQSLISNVSGASPPGRTAQGSANSPGAAGGAQAAGDGTSGGAANKGTQTNPVAASTLDQAMQTLQKAAEQQGASIAFSAGLDTEGGHPGQVLIELKDTVTKQVFYQRLVPAEQVVQAAQSAQEQGVVAPGALISGKV